MTQAKRYTKFKHSGLPKLWMDNFQGRVLSQGGVFENYNETLQFFIDNEDVIKDASIVITPNAYGLSKVFAFKPFDGSGDLTYTRNSTATRYNSAGLVEVVPANFPRLNYVNGVASWLSGPQRTNLLLRSEELNVSPWGTLGTITITPNNTIAPDGNNSADLILGDNSISSVNQIIGGVTGIVYTNSFFIKNNNSTQSRLTIRNLTTAVECNINWSGSILSSITNILGISTFQNYGNGWYRIISTYTSVESAQRPRVLPTLSTNQSVYIWGAQLEVGSYVTSYITTVASAVTRVADSYVKTGVGHLFTNPEGVLKIRARSLDVPSGPGSNNWIFSIYLNGSNYIGIYYSSVNSLILDIMSAGVSQVITTPIGSFDVLDWADITATYGGGQMTLKVNDLPLISAALNNPIPSGLNSYGLGYFATLKFRGSISSIIYKNSL